MSTKRYIVEQKDEFGWCDYDSFAQLSDALALAKQLREDGHDIRVVDSVEQAHMPQARVSLCPRCGSARAACPACD